MQDGSAPAGMWAITQTSDGFLWFSSHAGDIYRFDGIKFEPSFQPADRNAVDVPSAKITGVVVNIYGDHGGGLWVLSRAEIVHVRGGVVVARFALKGMTQGRNVSEAPDGTLWVTRGFNTDSDEPLCHVTDHDVKCFGKADGIPISPIDSLLADGEGGFWLGGQTTLVHWKNGISITYAIEGLNKNVGQDGITSLARGPDGTLWLGMLAQGPGLGVARLIGDKVRSFSVPGFDGSNLQVNGLDFDRDGNLWVATSGQGLFRIHGRSADHYGMTNGLSSNSVLAVDEDREGNVWATTTNGVDSFRDPLVTTYSSQQGLGGDLAGGVLARNDGTIWVANAGSLDHIVHGKVTSLRTGRGLPGNQVGAMLEDRAGNMWLGIDDGLYLFDKGTFHRLPEPDHKPLGLVVGLTEDSNGDIWAECSGSSRKLLRIRDFQVREEFTSSQVPAGHALSPDPDGGIWIGSIKGNTLLHLRNGNLKSFMVDPSETIFSSKILAQTDGSVLASSVNGLVGLRNGKVQQMAMNNGLPCNSVISFQEDRNKIWWLYTGCGIVELPDSELQRWWADPQIVVHFRFLDVTDGAQPGQPSFNSAASSSDGRVWFANGVGVQMLDSSTRNLNGQPPATYVESVLSDRKLFPAIANLSLAPNVHDLQIDYTSPTFASPQKVKFRYRLVGYDHDWQDAGTRRQAFYNDLPPGKYSFLVIASNSQGMWNSTPTRFAFSVAPAYYQMSWFRILIVGALLALLWAAYQLRMIQMQQQFAIMSEARINERTRIARELHDTLLQSAHGLLLSFETVAQLLPNRPTEAKQKLDEAIQQTANMVTEARDEVQGLRDSAANTSDIGVAICSLGRELANGTSSPPSPEFQVTVEGSINSLHPLLYDEIHKIATEALRNAFRHAKARKIEVEIRYDLDQFRLRIRDDGRGIDPHKLTNKSNEGHFGLRGMQERAALIGGELVVWSEGNEGTEIDLHVPAAAAYVTRQKRRWFTLLSKA